MKKRLLKTSVLCLITMTLSSCALIDIILGRPTTPVPDDTYTYTPIDPSEEGDGYYKPSSMSFKATDFDPAFSPSSGDVKLLIIPIQFKVSGSTTFTYTSVHMNHIKDRYFGDDASSLKTYYKNASHDSLNLSGEIANVYTTTKSVTSINNDETGDSLSTLLQDAYDWTLSNNSNINFADYDINNDGFIDSVHFMVNLSSTAFESSLNSRGELWPHMWYLQDTHNNPGTHTKPNIDVYLCTNYGMIDDTTSIHEQGHVFGVDDYYNYSEDSSADYVGGADMQDLNCFDWNPYSKMLMNWTQPYVVDGSADSVTIQIQPSASTGDCILIPANHSKWNGSAYDEYILIELFSKTGNNQTDWDDWTNIARMYGSKGAGSLGNGGIRMYHVDSRLYGFNTVRETTSSYIPTDGKYISNPTTTGYNNVCLPQTNSSTNTDYSMYAVAEAKNFHLLSLIQAGKVNTFKTGTTRNALTKGDLFQTGDKFTMSDYSSFFINGKFNNGDSFPYTITFENVSPSGATVVISK